MIDSSPQIDHPWAGKNRLLAWSMCLLGIIFYCYEYFLRIEPSVMVDQLQQTYHITLSQVALLSSLYYVAYAPMQLLVGVITDLYGPRWVLLSAVFFCVMGSLLFGYADHYYMAGLGRLLIGFGSAFAFIGALKLAAIWLPRNKLGFFAGCATALGMLGALSGEIELSVLVQHVGWHQAIHLGSILGVIIFILLFLFLRDHPHDQREHSNQLSSAKIAWGLKQVFRSKPLWLIGLVGCMLYLSLAVFSEMWGVQFLKVQYHSNTHEAAIMNSAVFWGWIVGAPLMGWLSEYLKIRRRLIWYGAAAGLIAILFLLYSGIPSKLLAVFTMFIFGFSCSVEIICFVMARESVPEELTATAMAFVNMLVMFSGLIVQPVVGWLLTWSHQHSIQHPQSLIDYRVAFLFIPLGLLLVLMVAKKIPIYGAQHNNIEHE